MSALRRSDIDVTVVVATHRREEQLARALASIARQTLRSLEVIVVDDNADDTWNTQVQTVVAEFGSQVEFAVVCHRNEHRLGSAESRNVGIRLARGEYVTFLDDDDVYMPEKVKRQMLDMRAQESDYSVTDFDFYSESGRLVERRQRTYLKGAEAGELMRLHYMFHITGTDTLMFRRQYLLAIGGFPPIDVGDEFYLMREAIAGGGRFSYLPACDVRATVYASQDNLSSGQSKIDGENALFVEKQSRFHEFDHSTIAYITMRHYAVLAYAELRRGRWLLVIPLAGRSFLASPAGFVSILWGSR